MPRGENPNSRKNLIVNSERTPKQRRKQASKAGKASGETRAATASLTADLRERCTPERIQKINDRILSMAEHGNLRAYELIRDGLGEKPKETVDVNAAVSEKLDSILSQIGGEGLEE